MLKPPDSSLLFPVFLSEPYCQMEITRPVDGVDPWSETDLLSTQINAPQLLSSVSTNKRKAVQAASLTSHISQVPAEKRPVSKRRKASKPGGRKRGRPSSAASLSRPTYSRMAGHVAAANAVLQAQAEVDRGSSLQSQITSQRQAIAALSSKYAGLSNVVHHPGFGTYSSTGLPTPSSYGFYSHQQPQMWPGAVNFQSAPMATMQYAYPGGMVLAPSGGYAPPQYAGQIQYQPVSFQQAPPPPSSVTQQQQQQLANMYYRPSM